MIQGASSGWSAHDPLALNTGNTDKAGGSQLRRLYRKSTARSTTQYLLVDSVFLPLQELEGGEGRASQLRSSHQCLLDPAHSYVSPCDVEGI